MTFAGLRGTGKFGPDERPGDFRELILWARPNGTAPLTALMAKMKSERTDFATFNWWEEKLEIVRVQTSGSYTTTATTLTLASGGLKLVPGDILQVEVSETTNYDVELLEVSSVTNDTTIVVKRGAANTTPVAISSNFLTKVGNAFYEGSKAPDVSLRNPTKLTNYCQIFKTVVGQTKTSLAERGHRTGDPWKNDKIRKAFDHAAALEFAFLFGKPFEDTSSGTHPRRFTGGLRHFITTNVTIFTTTPTEDTFLNAIYKVFDWNVSDAGDERLMLCGNGFLNSLNKLAKNSPSTRINFSKVVDLYGMKLQEWITPQGRFYARTHPLLNQHGRYTNSAFIIDPSSVIYRYLRDTKFVDDIQSPDEDIRKGVWLTEAGIEVHHEYTSAYIGNFVV